MPRFAAEAREGIELWERPDRPVRDMYTRFKPRSVSVPSPDAALIDLAVRVRARAQRIAPTEALDDPGRSDMPRRGNNVHLYSRPPKKVKPLVQDEELTVDGKAYIRYAVRHEDGITTEGLCERKPEFEDVRRKVTAHVAVTRRKMRKEVAEAVPCFVDGEMTEECRQQIRQLADLVASGHLTREQAEADLPEGVSTTSFGSFISAATRRLPEEGAE